MLQVSVDFFSIFNQDHDLSLKGELHRFYTSISVIGVGEYYCEKSSIEPFVAPVGAALNSNKLLLKLIIKLTQVGLNIESLKINQIWGCGV